MRMFFHWKRPVGPGSEALATYRGTLTAQGAGAVNVGQLSAGPFVATGSSFTLISGTAGHWTTPTDGTTPAPTSAGVTAGLNGGPYVFTYTSTDGVNSRAGNFTINTRANTRTVSLRSEVYTARTSGPLASLSTDGITIELARGATDFANATAASPFYIFKWRAATGLTLANEDDTHPTPIGNLYIQLPKNLTLRKLKIRPALRVGSVDKAIWARTSTPAAATDQTTTNSFTTDNCDLDGVSADPTQWVYGWYISADGAPLTWNMTGVNTTQRVFKGMDFDDGNDFGLTFNQTGQFRVRYWSADGLICNYGASGKSHIYFQDLLFMSPMFDTSHSGTHPDCFQLAEPTAAVDTVFDKFTFIQADGNSISQTIFSNNTTTALMGVTVKNALSCGRSHHTISLGATDATHVARFGNYTAVGQWSGVFGADDPPGNFNLPGAILNVNVHAAYLNLKNIWQQGAMTNNSDYVPTADVVHYGDTTGDISSVFPNAGRISSPALRSAALANATTAFTGNADTIWTQDIDTVRAFVETALTPASGQLGALMSDGSRPLATFP